MENRQAVIVIHGIGEQKPMDTLRGFVDTIVSPIWDSKQAKRDLNPNSESTFERPKFYSKPDELSSLFELRRLTVPGSGDRLKTDFFEYYWAYNFRDTKIKNVLIWISSLLLTSPFKFPKRLYLVYAICWLLISFSLSLIVTGIFPIECILNIGKQKSIVYGIVSLGLIPVLSYLATHYLGDAARYTNSAPENIAERQKIRSEGLLLLRKLHAEKKYKRIIIVGHSLGSIIGYDLIKHFWAECHTKVSMKPEDNAFAYQFEASYAGSKNVDVTRYMIDQEKLFQEQSANGNPWRITHFITLGSPLAHAALLLAKSEKEFLDRINEREFPTSPPFAESIDGELKITYQYKLGSNDRVLHHATPFACTKWTNLYYNWDFIGGSLRNSFGEGIDEPKVRINKNLWYRFIPFAAHTKYWGKPGSNHKLCSQSAEQIKRILGF